MQNIEFSNAMDEQRRYNTHPSFCWILYLANFSESHVTLLKSSSPNSEVSNQYRHISKSGRLHNQRVIVRFLRVCPKDEITTFSGCASHDVLHTHTCTLHIVSLGNNVRKRFFSFFRHSLKREIKPITFHPLLKSCTHIE